MNALTENRIALIAVAACFGVAGADLRAQCQVIETAKFIGDTVAEQTQFGTAMQMDANRAVIGADGTAFVFERNTDGTWSQMQELVPDVVFGGYAESVAIHGDVALVGCLFVGGHGGAYVFRYDGSNWNQERVLDPNGGDGNDDFGYGVAINGNIAVIGGPQYYLTGNTGQAVVFQYDGVNWIQQQTLRASDGQSDDEFGNAVAIDDDVIVIGAYNEGHNDRPFKDGTGAAYVFRRDRITGVWAEEARLVSADPVPGELDQFGFALDIDGEELLIGTNPIAFSQSPKGSAYIFRYNGNEWEWESKLVASDGQGGDRFGSAVALAAGVAVCGAWGEWSVGTQCPFPEICHSGSAYLFTRSGTTWTEARKFFSSDIERDDRFAWSVGVSDQAVAAGAWGDDDRGTLAGAAYGFDLPDCAPPDLEIDSNCPDSGAVTLRWSNTTPGGRIAIVLSPSLGEFTVPNNKPCAGTTLDLQNTGLRVVLVRNSDSNGQGRVHSSAPAGVCGKFLQLVDLTTCAMSAPERIR